MSDISIEFETAVKIRGSVFDLRDSERTAILDAFIGSMNRPQMQEWFRRSQYRDALWEAAQGANKS